MVEYAYIQEDIRSILNQFGTLNNEDEELIRFLSKKLVFLKEIKISIGSNEMVFYIDQMISDLLYLIDSYFKNEIRYIYLNIRSLIEAYARLFSLVDPKTNRITMTNLLDNINSYISINSLKDNKGNVLDYPRLKGLYSECCLYVHGSINANYSLADYYKELFEVVTIRQKRKISNDIKFLVNLLITISCYRFSSILNDFFFRGKKKMSYLIGDFLVDVVKRYSNIIVSCFLEKELLYTIVLTDKIGNRIRNIDFEFEDYIITSCTLPKFTYLDEFNIFLECELLKKS